ncbi:MAG: FHA domain-containing protein [Propionibacteriaceae bacterium]|jgi:S-DNA-T family DNA segregation ATPase FtsK/SpoIIIE|nr:FHA domain-containing protein [Propionibacteriaceae bacterium]
MKLKVTLLRRSGGSDEILIEADASTTIGEVAQTIQRVDRRQTGPAADPTLTASLPGQDQPVHLSPQSLLGEAWIGSGADITVVDRTPARYAVPATQPVRAVLRVEPPAGAPAEHALTDGTYDLGRAPDCDICLTDPLVSKHHLRIEASEAAVEVIDAGSANGTLVDDTHIQRLKIVAPTRLLVGDTWVTLTPAPQRAAIHQQPGPVPFTRSPRVEARYAGETFEAPEPPAETEAQPFPFLALLTPVLMGTGMYVMTGRLTSLMFVFLTPVMLVGNFVTQKSQRKRRRKKDIARFEERLAALTSALAGQVPLERAVRLAEAPSTPEVYDAAMARGPLLWTRRAEHWSFLNVRLGTGTMPSRDTVDCTKGRGALLPDFQERLDAVVTAHETITDVPIVENLVDAGALGFAGPPTLVGAAVDSVIIQLTGLHSPAELVIAGFVTPDWARRLDWLLWLPHTSAPTSPIVGHHLSDSATTATRLIAQLEGIVTTRLGARTRTVQRGAMKTEGAAMERGAEVGTKTAEATTVPLPVVVVLVSAGLDIDQARLVQLAEQGADAGVFLVWIADDVTRLPATCRTFVAMAPDATTVGMVRLGLTITDAELDLVEPGRAMAYARRLAPVFDAGNLVEDAGDIPRSVPLPGLLGAEIFARPEAIIDRWAQNQSLIDRRGPARAKKRVGTLRALVGSSGVDPMTLDLRTQGPHALVGGTTGSGKSEFLQAWVLAMAAEYSPDRVTFLFVDYKGGAAFADCVRLPHCVGLVTDLSPHLVVRALTSLRAELHFREHLFQRKKAKDILELERRGDPECPPALVIVIDEFAALVGDVPEFVDGVVDVAQRGRSLGIHLVMATQRPAGVIRDNLRANTNLRVALRMADESDSKDVVEVKDAAHFDPGIPGRGVVKTGPGRLTTFQSGYAGGWTTDEPDPARVDVYRLAFGGLERWEEPESLTQAVRADRDLGPNDQQRFVACAIAAFTRARLPAPRRPWLDELPAVCPLPYYAPDPAAQGRLAGAQQTDTALLLGLTDLPSEQAQRPVYFHPDTDGHLGIYGTSGSGKSVALRTLAASAGLTAQGGPVYVYALDFAAGGLRMLEGLPHVAVVKGEETEKVVAVLRTLGAELAARGDAFADLAAASVTDYRRLRPDPGFPRLLLLIDGFGAFRDEFESGAGRAEWYEVFRDILGEGRGLGLHVVFTADRATAVPTYVRSLVPRNLLLRMGDDGYLSFSAPRDIVTATSPAGRGVIDRLEVQIAVLGGTADVAQQAKITAELGQAMARHGIARIPGVRILPPSYPGADLPDAVGGLPVLGLDSIGLAPYGFNPLGVMLVSGPAASGRTNALAAIVMSMVRARPASRCYLLSAGKSTLVDAVDWAGMAVGTDRVQALATELLALAKREGETGLVIAIESHNEFLQSSADKALVDLVKTVRNSSHFLVAEAETSAWLSTWPLLAEVKAARRGLLLRPDAMDGDAILKVSLPRPGRGEYPPGRGMFVARGKFTRIQVPLVLPG